MARILKLYETPNDIETMSNIKDLQWGILFYNVNVIDIDNLIPNCLYVEELRTYFKLLFSSMPGHFQWKTTYILQKAK